MRLPDSSPPYLFLISTLPSLIAAVSLADMAPRAANLPSACEAIYTAQIPNCTPQDLISGQCSEGCIYGMESLVDPVKKACSHRGISGENLIVAFLAGEGPKQICHNAPPSSGEGVPPGQTSWGSWPSSTEISHPTVTASPTFTATSTAQPETGTPSSLTWDTSKSPGRPDTTTTSPHTHTKPAIPASTTTSSQTPEHPVHAPASRSQDSSTSTPKSHPSSTTTDTDTGTSTATSSPSSSWSPWSSPETTSSLTTSTTMSRTESSKGNYQTNMHDGSGGGSPFDTQGNLGSGADGNVGPGVSLVALMAGVGVAVFWT